MSITIGTVDMRAQVHHTCPFTKFTKDGNTDKLGRIWWIVGECTHLLSFCPDCGEDLRCFVEVSTALQPLEAGEGTSTAKE